MIMKRVNRETTYTEESNRYCHLEQWDIVVDAVLGILHAVIVGARQDPIERARKGTG